MLINGTVNALVTCIVSLPIKFSCSYECILEFFVTKLENTYPAVLRHSWLTYCNPTIDWLEGTILCQKPAPSLLISLSVQPPGSDTTYPTKPTNPTPRNSLSLSSRSSSPIPTPNYINPQTESLTSNRPAIAFISANAFQHACKAKGVSLFQLSLNLLTLTGQVASIREEEPELSNVSRDYWQFSDIFCKQKAKTLSDHRSYDLSIQIEQSSLLLLGPIYSLSATELQTLQEFINKNTKTGIIRPSNSPCGAPVLFIKKKDGTLQLCINYWGLNRLTHKDRYSILLITDLLNVPKKAQYYMKIDLRSTYHLVYIARSDEWKTVINCSFPLRHFHYSFNFFSCSIYSVGKSVTLCDTSVTESRHMSHIIWLGVRDSRCTDHWKCV